MKTCTGCKVDFTEDAFYARSARCKECVKAAVKKRYQNERPKIMAYERKRNQEPSRKAKQAVYLKRRRERDPTHDKARWTVSNAIRDGRLVRQPCQVCGTTVKVQAHHHDYNKPLDVEWLCFLHHREHAHGQVVSPAA